MSVNFYQTAWRYIKKTLILVVYTMGTSYLTKSIDVSPGSIFPKDRQCAYKVIRWYVGMFVLRKECRGPATFLSNKYFSEMRGIR